MRDLGLTVEVQVRILHRHRKILTSFAKAYERTGGIMPNRVVVTVEEVEDWIEGFAVDELGQSPHKIIKIPSDISLDLDAFGKCECCHRSQWKARVLIIQEA